MRPPSPVLVTSPIFYVNAVPHIGHLYSAVIADTLARWYAFKGHHVIYSTGTDEHGLKIQEASKKANTEPKMFCDQISEKFKELFDSTNVGYTRFIRTTDSDHYTAVEAIWRKLVENGFIYKGRHEGWYCISDETFYPETQIEEVKDEVTGELKMVSKETRKTLEWTAEENYKFRLSMMRPKLIEWLERNPEAIIPKTQYLNTLKSLMSEDDPISDISVSRPASRVKWGITVPDDPNHVVYVWLDALTNYLTVSGYPHSLQNPVNSFWPARWHVVGKDIIKFHAIYWPAFLLAADLPPPMQILSHAHWLQNKTKMSKSLGNVTDPSILIKEFSVDVVRYFLMRDGGIEYDVDFSNDMVMKRYRELANQLGNLVMRCSGKKVNAEQVIPHQPGSSGLGIEEVALKQSLETVREKATICFESGRFGRGLESILETVGEANRYWDRKKPWVLASKTDPESMQQLQTSLFMCFETVRVSALLLSVVMPEKMGALLDWLHVAKEDRVWDSAVLQLHSGLSKSFVAPTPMFPKL
ncbi:methionyl-tRNA synthetase [Entophlyctis luteolus]|nr:methionyl-tRNA synthetase [Entophlyctis luteolus]KAJ3346088.1 methionyl-tRNA synthetase [Entophlyctis luteolus]KAJ3387385.1 methionyl-tRNA synthetase [Entophlyctis sp. JEL0112]